MNTLIVYESVFGNTQALAEAIAQVIRQKGTVRLSRVDQFSAAEAKGNDLILVGCPTHRHSVPRAVRTLLESVPRKALRGIAVAAFDTRYQMARWKSGSAAPRVAHKLRRLGGRQVAAPESFFVDAREGPLAKGELERAQGWAESILGQLEG